MQDSNLPDQEAPLRRRRKRGNNMYAGVLLLGIGSLLLMRKFGLDLPGWLFSWPMILVVVGFFVGAVNNFKDFSWIIISGIGGFFLIDRIYPELDFGDFIFPLAIIMVGLVVLVGSRRNWRRKKGYGYTYPGTDSQAQPITEKDELLDTVSVFGGVKKVVYSKSFKGGEIVNIFGGSDIDLTQADFTGTINIEVVQIFGGTKLIVPPHWEVRSSESVAIFGGIDDKRSHHSVTNPEKILIISGTTVFGGLDIRSY